MSLLPRINKKLLFSYYFLMMFSLLMFSYSRIEYREREREVEVVEKARLGAEGH